MRTKDVWLDIAQAAQALGIPGTKIRRWAEQGRLPAFRHGLTWRFREDDLNQWAREHQLAPHPKVDPTPVKTPAAPPACDLLRAITRGGVHHLQEPGGKVEALSALIRSVSWPESLNPEALIEEVLRREELASTGVGGGLALPHPGKIPAHIQEPILAIGLIRPPIAYESPDGVPVWALFLPVAPCKKSHLALLAKVSQLLRHRSFVSLLSGFPAEAEILNALRDTIQKASPPTGALP